MIFRKSANEAGFTLIEVLVALAIVGIALFAIVQASLVNIRNAEHIENKTEALWVASDFMARISNGFSLPPAFNQSNTIRQLGKEWQVIIDQTHEDKGISITITVGLLSDPNLVTLHGFE